MYMADDDSSYEQVSALIDQASQQDGRSGIICYSRSHYYAILVSPGVRKLYPPEGKSLRYSPRRLIKKLIKDKGVILDMEDPMGTRYVSYNEICVLHDMTHISVSVRALGSVVICAWRECCTM